MIYFNETTKEIIADVGTKVITIDATKYDRTEIAFACYCEVFKDLLKEMEQ